MAAINTATRLLLVEDEPTAVAALRKFFSAAGVDVDCASELEEAEALIVTTDYDVVIADLRLSWNYATEGLEILRFVRCHSRHPHDSAVPPPPLPLSGNSPPEGREPPRFPRPPPRHTHVIILSAHASEDI